MIKDSLRVNEETLYLICQWLANLAEDNINRAAVLIAAAYHAEEHLPSLADYLKDKRWATQEVG